MTELLSGNAQKMLIELAEPASYSMRLGDEKLALNQFLGQSLQLEFLGQINCLHCARKSNKSFGQGYCWPCFSSLARCDSCIMSPEKCHFDAGTCREPDWAQHHCMTDHIVYLANSSSVKVGITRVNQMPVRWLDQGATQALPIFRVATRQQSGLLEDALRAHVSDRTSWQAMLKADAEPTDLAKVRDSLFELCAEQIQQLQQRFGLQAITALHDAQEVSMSYPVLQYPTKVKSFNLDKIPLAEGTLLGIKGQYLIFDTGVINIRKYTSYQLALRA